MVNGMIKIVQIVLILLLIQISFGLVQENLLGLFPVLVGPVGFGLGVLGLGIAAFLLVKHIIPKFF